MAGKALQNNYYLESYTTAPERRLSPRDAGYFFFRRGFGEDLQLKILYNLGEGWVATGDPTGAQARSPANGSVCAKPAFSFKPSRLAGAISADVRSAERACRSELIMRERRLRSE